MLAKVLGASTATDPEPALLVAADLILGDDPRGRGRSPDEPSLFVLDGLIKPKETPRRSGASQGTGRRDMYVSM
jgi:hypothetical protein